MKKTRPIHRKKAQKIVKTAGSFGSGPKSGATIRLPRFNYVSIIVVMVAIAVMAFVAVNLTSYIKDRILGTYAAPVDESLQAVQEDEESSASDSDTSADSQSGENSESTTPSKNTQAPSTQAPSTQPSDVDQDMDDEPMPGADEITDEEIIDADAE